ncbi:MAG TPA: TIGR03668 family PPOX class F420-dependent oxidoreductase [Blastocatellia bacterium]|nr:TIGR03668 family PPOX class F420-dependent oxidoreductase [Blastocatellia bacterium]
MEIDTPIRTYISDHRVARLATADASGRPSVIPICYAFDGITIYSPIDRKPKSVSAQDLKRVRNLEENPYVSLVIDDYSDNWAELSYVQISGTARMIEPDDELQGEHRRAVEMLRDKYPQYRSMDIDRTPMIKITPTRLKAWRARPA